MSRRNFHDNNKDPNNQVFKGDYPFDAKGAVEYQPIIPWRDIYHGLPATGQTTVYPSAPSRTPHIPNNADIDAQMDDLQLGDEAPTATPPSSPTHSLTAATKRATSEPVPNPRTPESSSQPHGTLLASN